MEDGSARINDGGTWKTPASMWINDAGTWRQVWVNFAGSIYLPNGGSIFGSDPAYDWYGVNINVTAGSANTFDWSIEGDSNGEWSVSPNGDGSATVSVNYVYGTTSQATLTCVVNGSITLTTALSYQNSQG